MVKIFSIAIVCDVFSEIYLERRQGERRKCSGWT